MNAILQQVQKGEIVSLLLRGSEVAKLVPPDYAQTAARKELEILRQSAVVGDVLTPISEQWRAQSDTYDSC
ncbi:MAG: hypothetical protein KDE47_16070 [Caldilineaceae bacterium]|nr:hypothetical protein [Caldilineaceae bacterium]MCB9148453.1 type II toxin-antitoxin system prevent-host-death family antitoxin [Caldilineaceae bacterium]